MLSGSYFLGDGFLITHEAAASMRVANSRTRDVLRPVINGDELNNTPDQSPGRHAIFFRDWELEKACEYGVAFEHVERFVKPEREVMTEKAVREKWWLWKRPTLEIYRLVETLPRFFATARTTKHLNFSALAPGVIVTNAAYVFATDRWDLFALLQSTANEAWARKYSGALETRLRYSPSDCFDTLAVPEGLWQTPSAGLADIGSRYHEHRRQLMLSLWLGLTDVYNLFHSRELDGDLAKHFAKRAKKDPQGLLIPEEHRAGAVAFTLDAARAGIVELRRLHVELDTAVRDAYGWHDLPLEHDFYEVETLPENDRVRYTISPAARKELLKRLLAENHRRAAAESASVPPVREKPSRKRRSKAVSEKDTSSPSLFDSQ